MDILAATPPIWHILKDGARISSFRLSAMGVVGPAKFLDESRENSKYFSKPYLPHLMGQDENHTAPCSRQGRRSPPGGPYCCLPVRLT